MTAEREKAQRERKAFLYAGGIIEHCELDNKMSCADVSDAIAEAYNAGYIQAKEDAEKWIDVNNALPSAGERVLIQSSCGRQVGWIANKAREHENEVLFCIGFDSEYIETVATHWRKI